LLPPVVVVAAHGGAGATTVADLLRLAGPAADVTEARHCLHDPAGAALLVVARTTASGTAAAAWHVTHAPRPARLHLVLVADAPAPPPLACRYRARALKGVVAAVTWVPWVWSLRAVDRVTDADDAQAVRRAAAALRDAVTAAHQSTPAEHREEPQP
jgi:hypothetical protein